jgi:transposase
VSLDSTIIKVHPVTRLASSRSIWALSPWCRRTRSGSSPGGSKALYRRRNEIERLFRRLKGFRRVFSRFDKLDLVFIAFVCFALIVEALRQ